MAGAHATHHPKLQHHFDNLDQQFEASALGMWLFLVTEILFFGGLFATYTVFRSQYSHAFAEASGLLNVNLGGVNTIVLISSSVTMVMAWYSLKMDRFGKFRLYMAATVGFGAVFLVVKYFEYSHHFEIGEGPGHNNFLAIYFTLTGLHALHIIGGVLVIGYFWGPGSRMWFTDPERFTNRVEVAGLFWHFVDLVWIFLFPVLYLL